MEKKEQGIELILKLAEQMDKLVEVGEEAFEDGKVDLADAMLVPKLFPIAQELFAIWKEKEDLKEELKDLDWNELKEIGDKVL